MQWYYTKDGQQIGPFEERAFDALVRSGDISPDTQVWHAGLSGWLPYSSTEQKPKLRINKRELPKPDVGKVMDRVNPADLVAKSSGHKKQPDFRFAGIWLRGIAAVLDTLVMAFMLAAFGALAYGLKFYVYKDAKPTRTLYEGIRVSDNEFYIAIGLAAVAFLSVFFYKPYWTGKNGATLGKKWLKMKVIRSSGEAITPGRAMGRFFAEHLSLLFLAIGYLMIAFDKQKRALHDRICDTRVIRER